MAVEAYPDQLEPENQDAVIWRFIDMEKFRDLMATGELYFCRADLFPKSVPENLRNFELIRRPFGGVRWPGRLE